MNDLRCLQCRGEFDSSEYPTLYACPGCGATTVPADPRLDQDWVLTSDEWQRLLVASEAWVVLCAFEGGANTIATLRAVVNPPQESDAPHTVRTSPHEVRILTIWASNAVLASPEGTLLTDADLERVLEKLRQQAPPSTPLTIGDEVGQLRDRGFDVELRYDDPEC